MNFDAIITFNRVLRQQEISYVDKMMLLSAINNYCIDINFSLRDNLRMVDSSEISKDDFNIYLSEILGDDSEILDKKLYLLLLERPIFHSLLISANKLNVLSDDTICNIIEFCLEFISISAADINEVFSLISELLCGKIDIDRNIYQRSNIIFSFIYMHIANLFDKYSDEPYIIYTNKIVLKLLEAGYSSFSALSNSEFKLLFDELLNRDAYGYIKLIFNKYTVNEDQKTIILDILDMAKDKNYDNNKFMRFYSDMVATIEESSIEKSIDDIVKLG